MRKQSAPRHVPPLSQRRLVTPSVCGFEYAPMAEIPKNTEDDPPGEFTEP